MLVKLSQAIRAEYSEPYPHRETALRHFRERYHCEKRGGKRGTWWVDLSRRPSGAAASRNSTGIAEADDILRRTLGNG